MPSAEPMKAYQEALKLHVQGNNDQAAQVLAGAMGAEKASTVIMDFLDKFLEHDTETNDIILRIIATESAKSKKKAE
jgi:hypothetical protein